MALQKKVPTVTCVISSPATPTCWLKNGFPVNCWTLLYFRVAGNPFVQGNGLRGLGKDGGGFFRGEGDFRNACMAQSVARVAEQRSGSEMAVRKHHMSMATQNDVDIRRILHHFQIVVVSQVAEDDIDGVMVQAEPVRDALVILFIRQFP